MKSFISMVAAAAIVASAGKAQNQAHVTDKQPQELQHDIIGVAGPGAGNENMMFERRVVLSGRDVVEFVSTESSIGGKVVKGAPYSAEAVTESIQVLSDGNRIVSKSSATTYRDSEGRTRREMSLPMPGGVEAPVMVTINDPVAGVSYHLDSLSKTARKLPVGPEGAAFNFTTAVPAMNAVPAVRMMRGTAVGGTHEAPEAGATAGPMITIPDQSLAVRSSGVRVNSSRREPKTESLGKRDINGVQAEGSRTTITIPAGEIGNEREILIVSERWYSPELQTVVLSKHSDPRVGENTYTLTNLKRSEPHPSMFEAPADYSVAAEESVPGVRVMRKSIQVK